MTYGGGAGGGKSRSSCTWSSIQCRKSPGIRIGPGRNEISNLRKTTAQAFLGKVYPALGIRKGHDFRYSALVNPGIHSLETKHRHEHRGLRPRIRRLIIGPAVGLKLQVDQRAELKH